MLKQIMVPAILRLGESPATASGFVPIFFFRTTSHRSSCGVSAALKATRRTAPLISRAFRQACMMPGYRLSAAKATGTKRGT
jgi:hypothetical protein